MYVRHYYEFMIMIDADADDLERMPIGWWGGVQERARAALTGKNIELEVGQAGEGYFTVEGRLDIPEGKYKQEMDDLSRERLPRLAQSELFDPVMTDLEQDISEADATGVEVRVQANLQVISISDSVAYDL
jgi:hypothetical protein